MPKKNFSKLVRETEDEFDKKFVQPVVDESDIIMGSPKSIKKFLRQAMQKAREAGRQEILDEVNKSHTENFERNSEPCPNCGQPVYFVSFKKGIDILTIMEGREIMRDNGDGILGKKQKKGIKR